MRDRLNKLWYIYIMEHWEYNTTITNDALMLEENAFAKIFK